MSAKMSRNTFKISIFININITTTKEKKDKKGSQDFTMNTKWQLLWTRRDILFSCVGGWCPYFRLYVVSKNKVYSYWHCFQKTSKCKKYLRMTFLISANLHLGLIFKKSKFVRHQSFFCKIVKWDILRKIAEKSFLILYKNGSIKARAGSLVSSV